MNNLDYLNEIAKDNRPVAPSQFTANARMILKIIIGGIIAFGAILIIGAVINSSTAAARTAFDRLYVRTVNLQTAVDTYNKALKSSSLRAIGTSLSSTLSGATNQLTGYATNNSLDPTANTEVIDSESVFINELDTTLNTAKFNGIIDRIYASELTLQVSLLLTLISDNLTNTKDEDLITILQQFQSNLDLTERGLEEYAAS